MEKVHAIIEPLKFMTLGALIAGLMAFLVATMDWLQIAGTQPLPDWRSLAFVSLMLLGAVIAASAVNITVVLLEREEHK